MAFEIKLNTDLPVIIRFFCDGSCTQISPTTNLTLADEVGVFFPSAAEFKSFVVNNTGHGVQLHESVGESTGVLLEFIGGL